MVRTPPPHPSKRRGLVPWLLGLGVLGTLGTLGWAAAVSRLETNEPLPVERGEEFGSPPLEKAAQEYWRLGGSYVWGKNDCSSFVTEYLRGIGGPSMPRLTTKWMDEMADGSFGLWQTSTPRPGDVLNYRYPSQEKPGMAGHCGVVIKRGDDLWVIHNAEALGLVRQRLEGFYARAAELGASRDQVRILSPTVGRSGQ
jgi:hypothetical protein